MHIRSVSMDSAQKGLDKWDSNKDVWELYNIKEDFSQFNNLAEQNPEKLKELQAIFSQQAKENLDWPIGALASACGYIRKMRLLHLIPRGCLLKHHPHA